MMPGYFLHRAWFAQVRRMRRSDPIYKPAMLLVVLDLLGEGPVVPPHVSLALAAQRFDELLTRAGLLESRGAGRAFMPAYHLSSSSKTVEPFWSLLHAGQPLGPQSEPSSVPALLQKAHALALCQTHHWAFDLGLWSTDTTRRVVVAPASGQEDGLAELRQLEGKPLSEPASATARPHADALLWHREHVFRTAV